MGTDMAIRVIWDNEDQTVIRFIYEGRWTWKEFYPALDRANTMMQDVNHQVDVIIDLQNSSLIPSGAVSRGKRVGDTMPPNQGATAVVGANMLMRSLYDVFRTIYRKDLNAFFAASLEEARLKLEELRLSTNSVETGPK